MTTATLAPVSGNVVITGFALSLVIAFIYGAILWKREGQMDRHDDKLAAHAEQLATLAYQMPALLEYLRIEIPAPVADDSPEAMANERETGVDVHSDAANERERASDDTEEFPAVQPDTEPMAVVDPTPAVQARRDAAWDAQRPSPVPRDTEYVTREVNIGGVIRSFRIPAMREDA